MSGDSVTITVDFISAMLWLYFVSVFVIAAPIAFALRERALRKLAEKELEMMNQEDDDTDTEVVLL